MERQYESKDEKGIEAAKRDVEDKECSCCWRL